MKKANFKKMALLGITVGLSVAANASACCGRDKGPKESDSSSDLSVLNKASENFYLAGGGCAPGSCSPKRPPRGTTGNISMADEPAQGTMMQGGKMQGGQMQGGEMQGGQMQGGEMQGGQMQGQPQEQQPQTTPPQRKNHNQNGKSSGSCSAALLSSGLNS